MKFAAKIKMPYINKNIKSDLDIFFKNILFMTARYFIQGMVSLQYIPAWTGQARASLTAAAIEVGVTINYSDAIEPNRRGKNASTGASQGKAFWEIKSGEYIFEFTSTVSDLNKSSGFNYWEENEYEVTKHNRIRQTPWGTIEEAGIETEKYIIKTIFPLIRKFLKKNVILTTRMSV